MNSNPQSILNRPYTNKEFNNRNRNLTAYNIFSACFYFDYVNSDSNTKRRLMVKYGIKGIAEFAAADDDSIISEPEALPHEVMKMAAGEWGEMSGVLKNAWKDRCVSINQLPVLGVFHVVPPVLVSNLNGHVMQSLTYEFDRFTCLIRQALRSKLQIGDSIKVKTLGKEKFELGDKVWRTFYFNHMLKVTIFGEWDSFSRVQKEEITYRKRMTKVIHIASRRRLMELFSLNGVCPFTMEDDGRRNAVYCCGGKVVLKDILSGREGIGMVDDEDTNDADSSSNL